KKADITYVDSGLSKKADITYVDSGLSKKADITYVDSGLSKKADITYVDSLVPLKSFMGSGFPEGKVEAPVGSIYMDTAATNGAIRWIKTSGTSTSGWRVEYGDTGWRELVPINGWVGVIYVRRLNDVVFYRGKISAETASATNAWDIPSGFRAGNIVSSNGQGYVCGRAMVSTEESEPKVRCVSFYFSRFSITSQKTSHTYGINLSYPTTNDWPATLPGVPAY